MSDINKLNAFFKSYSEVDNVLEYKLAHEMVGEKFEVISTGSHLLDDALSSGGLPCGRLIQYYGRAGSGKTLMTMLAIKNAQKKDPEAKQVFIDAEQTFSPDWAETLGVDSSKVVLIQDELAVNGRRLFEMLLGKPKEDAKHKLAGKSKEGLLDQVVNGNININLFILDSLGQIIPPSEDTAEIGKQNISLLSRFLTPTFRKLSLEVKKANVPFIIINHARDSMNQYIDHAYAGGNSYSHSLSANIWFEAVSRKDSQILDEKEQKIGHIMRATVEKSKFGPHPRKCEYKVDFSLGIVDSHEEIAQLAMKYDVVTKLNNVMYEYGENKYRGEKALFEALKDSVELQSEMILKIDAARDAIMEAKRNRQKESNSKAEFEDIDDSVQDDVDSVLNASTEPKKRGRKAKDSND